MDRRTFFKLIPALAAISHTQRLLPCSAAGNILPFPLNELRKTSIDNPKRNALPELKYIQDAADACTAKDFASYCTAKGEAAQKMRIKFAILNYFNEAFSCVRRSIESVQPRRGETHLFLLYNMGYVVKTPSSTFGIDICHPRAAELADKLDFLLITHNHSDHYSQPLIEALKRNGIPIVSNFIDTLHYSPGGRTFTFGEISVKTKCCDHNKRLEKFVLAYEIECGESAGNAIIFHSGDACSNLQALPDKTPDVFIPHLAVGMDIPKCAKETIKPKSILLSHILELGHEIGKWRWPISLGFKIANKCGSVPAYTPLWGDSFKITKA